MRAMVVAIVLTLMVTAVLSVAVGFLWLQRWETDAPYWLKLLFW